jgi:hypothetical protein
VLPVFLRFAESDYPFGIFKLFFQEGKMISHERGKDWEVFTSGTYPWSFVTQMFHIGQPSHGGDHKTFEVMTST